MSCTQPCPSLVLLFSWCIAITTLPASASHSLHVGLHNRNGEAAHHRAWNSICMSIFLFNSVLCLKESVREYQFVLRLLKDWCVAGHGYTFWGLAGKQFLFLLPQITGLSCDCWSGAQAEGGLLNSYQFFPSQVMVQLNPLTTLLAMSGVTGESLDEGYLAAECGRENAEKTHNHYSTSG